MNLSGLVNCSGVMLNMALCRHIALRLLFFILYSMNTRLLIGVVLAIIILLLQLYLFLNPSSPHIEAIDLTNINPVANSTLANSISYYQGALDVFYRVGPGKFSNGVFYILCFQDTTTNPVYYYGLICEKTDSGIIKLDGSATALPSSTIGVISFNKPGSSVLTPFNLGGLLVDPNIVPGTNIPLTSGLGEYAATSSYSSGPVSIKGSTIVF